jgi:hypothetical protein
LAGTGAERLDATCFVAPLREEDAYATFPGLTPVMPKHGLDILIDGF